MSALRSRLRASASWVLVTAVAAATAIGCSTAGESALESAKASGAGPAATPVVPTTVSVPSNARPTHSPASADAPPPASMSAEGGDPVVGQLGSYTWADGGSDSPWLPGSPMAVGAGEPLTVRLAAPAGVADWTATRVAAGTTDGSGAVVLAVAEGEPIRFIAPAAGRWSVQVQVRFGGGSDRAAYYWRIDVR